MTRADPDGPAVIVDPYSSGAFYAPAFAAAGVPTVAVRSGRAVAEVHRGGYRPEDFTAVIVNDGDVGAVVDQLRTAAEGGEKVLHWFEMDVTDPAGDVVAQVRKQVYVRKKRPT